DLGLEGWELYVVAHRARCHLDLGRWDAATEDAAFVLRSTKSVPLLQILALTVLGLVRARRGDPGQWSVLDECRALAEGQEELQSRLPVATARAEAAWLDGRASAVDEITRDTLKLAVERNATWAVGELAWLRRLAGIRETVPNVGQPYATQLAGDANGAAARW